jgi:hypothetical protein
LLHDEFYAHLEAKKVVVKVTVVANFIVQPLSMLHGRKGQAGRVRRLVVVRDAEGSRRGLRVNNYE